MTIRPWDRVLELGCGSGAVSLAAALRAADVRVYCVDSNVRAVECTRLGAELNGLANLDARLCAVESLRNGDAAENAFDLVLANPPYFSNHRLAEIFARCAARAIKPDGTALFVTKRTAWYEERFPELFASVTIEEAGNYRIVRGVGNVGKSPMRNVGD
jgi:16S rRNA G1207 methylase RsmC